MPETDETQPAQEFPNPGPSAPRALGGATAWRPADPTPDPTPLVADPTAPRRAYQEEAPPEPSPVASWKSELSRAQLALITALPVEERTYPAFLRTPRWRWWKPILAVLTAAVGYIIIATILQFAGLILDGTLMEAATGKLVVGPWFFLGNNVGLAAMIAVAGLLSWAFFAQRPRWLSSVTGGFRWNWFFRCVGVVLPLWVIMLGVEYAIGGLPPDLGLKPYTVLMLVGILLTTPLQAAGEEYLIRGLLTRAVGSYFSRDIVGWGVATIVASLTFMLMHGAGDPWLNVFYFTFGAAASWVTWKTGGLEAAVAIHVVNNLLSEAFLPFSDISGLFDRSSGAGGPDVLIGMAVIAVATALIIWQARRRGIAITAAPAASMQAPAAPMSYPPPAPNPYLAPGSTPEPGWGTYPGVPQPRWPQDVPPQTAPIEQDPLFNPRPWESGDRP